MSPGPGVQGSARGQLQGSEGKAGHESWAWHRALPVPEQELLGEAGQKQRGLGPVPRGKAVSLNVPLSWQE